MKILHRVGESLRISVSLLLDLVIEIVDSKFSRSPIVQLLGKLSLPISCPWNRTMVSESVVVMTQNNFPDSAHQDSSPNREIQRAESWFSKNVVAQPSSRRYWFLPCALLRSVRVQGTILFCLGSFPTSNKVKDEHHVDLLALSPNKI
jgi:hypothetical protein